MYDGKRIENENENDVEAAETTFGDPTEVLTPDCLPLT